MKKNKSPSQRKESSDPKEDKKVKRFTPKKANQLKGGTIRPRGRPAHN